MRLTGEIQAGQLIQAAALVITIGTGILVGYLGLQKEVYSVEATQAREESTQAGDAQRITSVERSLTDEITARQFATGNGDAKMSAMSNQLAGISAQLSDLKAELKR